MKITKHLKIASLISVACALVASVQAQTVPVYADQILGSFTCAAQSATNIGYVINCQKQASVMLTLTNIMSTSAVDNQSIVYSRSTDGINYGTTLYSIALAPTASAGSVQLTNIATWGAGYIKLNYFTNAAATAVSTNRLDYAIKIGAP